MIGDRDIRKKLVENARKTVDGKGAERIVAKMHLICEQGPTLSEASG